MNWSDEACVFIIFLILEESFQFPTVEPNVSSE